MTDESLAVYWPRGRRAVKPRSLPTRSASLEGKTVAFLWDYLFRGDEIFPLIEAGLRERFPGVRIVPYDTFGSTHGEDEHRIVAGLAERLRELRVDAVVSGIGC